MKITYDQEPSGVCPVQAEGEIDGLPFYFRSRRRHWTLHLATAPDGDPLDDDALAHREEYPSGGEFDASYAEPAECMEFIERAAAILLNPAEFRK